MTEEVDRVLFIYYKNDEALMFRAPAHVIWLTCEKILRQGKRKGLIQVKDPLTNPAKTSFPFFSEKTNSVIDCLDGFYGAFKIDETFRGFSVIPLPSTPTLKKGIERLDPDLFPEEKSTVEDLLSEITEEYQHQSEE